MPQTENSNALTDTPPRYSLRARVQRSRPPGPEAIRTLRDLAAEPERLVSPRDLVRCGLVGSYSTLDRWVSRGRLPRPYRPGGCRMFWRAGDVLAAITPSAPTGSLTKVA